MTVSCLSIRVIYSWSARTESPVCSCSRVHVQHVSMCPAVDCFLPQSMVLGSGPASLSLFVSSCWQLCQTAAYVSGVDSLVSVRVWPPSGPAETLSFHWDRQISASNQNKEWTCSLKFTMPCLFLLPFPFLANRPLEKCVTLPVLLCPLSPVSLKNVLDF